MPSDEEIKEARVVFAALGDRTRLKILCALRDGEELCVRVVAHVLGMSASAASHHLRKLRDLKILKYRTDGKMAYYSLRDRFAAELVLAAALAGRTMTGLGGWPRYAEALVPVVMGLHFLGWVRLRLPSFAPSARGRHSWRLRHGASPVARACPVRHACGSPPCYPTQPYEGSVPYGALLLFLFGLGAGLRVLLAFTVAGGIASRMDGAGWPAWVDRDRSDSPWRRVLSIVEGAMT